MLVGGTTTRNINGGWVGGVDGQVVQSLGPECENSVHLIGGKSKKPLRERRMATTISSTSKFVVSHGCGKMASIQSSRRVEMFFH